MLPPDVADSFMLGNQIHPGLYVLLLRMKGLLTADVVIPLDLLELTALQKGSTNSWTPNVTNCIIGGIIHG